MRTSLAGLVGLVVGTLAAPMARAFAEDAPPSVGSAPVAEATTPSLDIRREEGTTSLEVRGFPARSADGRTLVVHATTETAAGVVLSELVLFDSARGSELGRIELSRFEEMLALGHGHAAAERAASVIGARIARARTMLDPLELRSLAPPSVFASPLRSCRRLPAVDLAREGCPLRVRIESSARVVEARFADGSLVVSSGGHRLASVRAPRIVREGREGPCRHPALPMDAWTSGEALIVRFVFVGDTVCRAPGDVFRSFPLGRVRVPTDGARDVRHAREALRVARLPWEGSPEDLPRLALLALERGHPRRPLALALLEGAERALATDQPALAQAFASAARLVEPSRPEARYLNARALSALGATDEALAELRALSLDAREGRRLLDRARAAPELAPLRSSEEGRALLGAPSGHACARSRPGPSPPIRGAVPGRVDCDSIPP